MELLTPEMRSKLEIRIHDGWTTEVAKPISLKESGLLISNDKPMCQSCGGDCDEWVKIGGDYYHLSVDTCIENTRYSRKFSPAKWLSNRAANEYKIIDVHVISV